MDHARDPHRVRRCQARLGLGVAGADPAYPDAVFGICRDDARPAADRRSVFHILLYRHHPVFGRKWDQIPTPRESRIAAPITRSSRSLPNIVSYPPDFHNPLWILTAHTAEAKGRVSSAVEES